MPLDPYTVEEARHRIVTISLAFELMHGEIERLNDFARDLPDENQDVPENFDYGIIGGIMEAKTTARRLKTQLNNLEKKIKEDDNA